MLDTTPTRADRLQASRRGRWPRRILKIFVGLFVVAALVVLGAGGLFVYATGGGGDREPVVAVIPLGSTGADVANLLVEKDVVRSALAIRLVARWKGKLDSIAAGTYDLFTNMSVSDAIESLEEGPRPLKTSGVTIPEGYRLTQIAERTAKALKLNPKTFLDIATSGEVKLDPYLPAGTPTVEGFLFPKTYEFTKGTGERKVIAALLEQFRKDAGGLSWDAATKEFGITRYEAVVIASMVEREARVPEDRGKVARVIYNRLAAGMPLQIDATVQYGLPEYKDRLTFEDLEFDSPYNTYLHTGLPPTPIASPGLASLRAALKPTPGNWIYFVVINDEGQHAFTDSYDEFLELREQYIGS